MKRKKMKCFYYFIWRIVRTLFKVLYRNKVYGLEHFPEGGAIIAANHLSHLDPPLVSTSALEEVHFLARESLFKNPLFGKLIRALNSHPVSGDGSDVAVFKMICGLLKEGKKIILFPEGQRNFEDKLGPIKPGISLLVTRTSAPIIPTYVYGTFEIWKRAQRFPKLTGKTACVFGTPIHAETFAHLGKKEAQQAIADELTRALNALRAWYHAGAQGTPP